MKRAGLVESESGGLAPDGDGWFVLNARDARWLDGDLGKYCAFEADEGARFPQLGVNLNVLQTGEPVTMYHRERAQEDFLVLAGECLLVVEGEERPLRRWDLFHCPRGGRARDRRGEGRAVARARGRCAHRGVARQRRLSRRPGRPAARRRRGDRDLRPAREAYAPFSLRDCAYEEGWLAE